VWVISSLFNDRLFKISLFEYKSAGSLLGRLEYLLSFIHKLFFRELKHFPLSPCSEWDPSQSAVHTPFGKVAKSVSHQPGELEETQGKTIFLLQSP